MQNEGNYSTVLLNLNVAPVKSDYASSHVVASHTSSGYTPMMIFQVICFTVLCQMVDMFGIGTNIINIICFVRQGFKDPVNVSLFGLAIADLFCLTSLIWTNICMTPAFNNAEIIFESIEFQHPTSCVLHTTFTRLSGLITALITMERCLCITAPLKVKNIVTSKRMSKVIACTFLILLTSVAPVYVVSKLGYKFYPKRNKTLIGIIYTENRVVVERVSYAINNVFIPLGCFVIIITCTIILVTKLREKAKWRKTSTSGAQADNVSNRNQKVAKMVVMISTLFVICFFPVSITFIAMALFPELSMGGKYNDQLVVAVGVGFLLESINSSVNIFFYYRMSSKYRAAFRRLFNMTSEKDAKPIVPYSMGSSDAIII